MIASVTRASSKFDQVLMSSGLITCTRCKAFLLGEVFNTPDLVPCPSCGAAVHVNVFPAFFRGPAPGLAGEIVLMVGESWCFYHRQKKAIVPLATFSSFVCALFDCVVIVMHLCLSFLASGDPKGKLRNFLNR